MTSSALQVRFLPSIAYVNDQMLRIHVSASVYQPERRRGFNALLARIMGISPASLSEAERDYFHTQTALFKADSKRGQVITIELLDDSRYTLPETDRAGRTDLTIERPIAHLPHLLNAQNLLSWQAIDHDANGAAHYADNTGTLIIADIDDTLKDSCVADTQTLLQNTFLYPPKATPKMPDYLTQLSAQPHTFFAYVSSSPMQLYPMLAPWMANTYPAGPILLRQSTAWNEMLAGKAKTFDHKIKTIETLMDAYPDVSVMLIGDSGEQDPEIYHALYQRHSERITHIWIRNVTNEPRHAPRYANFPAIFEILP